MQTIGATNQSVAEAIGELVANCFDARLNNDQLNIIVDLRNQQIAVIDDGKGMTDDVLEHAVCIAEDMSSYVERSAQAKGHFGMGFKTSCSTLGRFYEIYTRPVGHDIEYHVEFDITSYSKRPSGADAWDVIIEDGPRYPSSPLGKAAHGSAFVIKRLNDPDISVDAIYQYLGTAFKGHIETGDSITVVTESGSYETAPKKRAYVEGTKIPINLRCGPDDSLHITGWVAIDKQTRNDALYGFNIYRNKQLVDPWNRDWIPKHLMTSRIFGEVEMDFLDATFYKQGLQQTENWRIASSVMREFLKPIVKASRGLSRKGNINNPSTRNQIVSTMREECGVAENPHPASALASNASSIEQGGETIRTQRSVRDKLHTIVQVDELTLEDGTTIPIDLVEMVSAGRVNIPFDYIYEDALEDEPTLQAIVYTDHPLFTARDSQRTIRILATADAIFRVLVVEHGIDPHKAFNIRNEWIARYLETKGDE